MFFFSFLFQLFDGPNRFRITRGLAGAVVIIINTSVYDRFFTETKTLHLKVKRGDHALCRGGARRAGILIKKKPGQNYEKEKIIIIITFEFSRSTPARSASPPHHRPL